MVKGGRESFFFIKDDKEIIKFFSVLLTILFLFLFFNSFFGIFEKKVCGDGTPYEECSQTLPYFCFKGVLVENASLCECPAGSFKNLDICDDKYRISTKVVNMSYVLNGDFEKLNFSVYKGLVDYLKKNSQALFYSSKDNYSLQDLKLRIIQEPEQKEFLIPLVIQIQNLAKERENQARIAISLVQNIPYENNSLFENSNPSSWSFKYPYDVLYTQKGLCGSKSDLLAFLLKELGYEVVIFHYHQENHEAVGIKCPNKYSLNNTGYCFVESTVPAIISYSNGEYSQQGKLYSVPEIIKISNGTSLKRNMNEYKDAESLNRIYEASEKYGKINFMEYSKFNKLTEKYGL